MLEERKRIRDSIRAIQKTQFEEKRKRLLEERQRRKDSLLKARNGDGGGL
jgi:hypothetical protein